MDKKKLYSFLLFQLKAVVMATIAASLLVFLWCCLGEAQVLLSFMWLEEWETEMSHCQGWGLWLCVFSQPHPSQGREEQGKPTNADRAPGHFSKDLVPSREGCKHSQLLHTSLLAAQSVCCCRAGQGCHLSSVPVTDPVSSDLAQAPAEDTGAAVMGNTRTLCSRVCVSSLGSFQVQPLPISSCEIRVQIRFSRVKLGLHLDACLPACVFLFGLKPNLDLNSFFSSVCLYQFIVSFYSCQRCFTLFLWWLLLSQWITRRVRMVSYKPVSQGTAGSIICARGISAQFLKGKSHTGAISGKNTGNSKICWKTQFSCTSDSCGNLQ